MTYVSSFMQTGSGIREFKRERGYRDRRTGWRRHKPTLGKKTNNTRWYLYRGSSTGHESEYREATAD